MREGSNLHDLAIQLFSRQRPVVLSRLTHPCLFQCRPGDSNPEAMRSELTRYASSRQTGVGRVGAVGIEPTPVGLRPSVRHYTRLPGVRARASSARARRGSDSGKTAIRRRPSWRGRGCSWPYCSTVRGSRTHPAGVWNPSAAQREPRGDRTGECGQRGSNPPAPGWKPGAPPLRPWPREVRREGIEPPPSGIGTRRSGPLSYRRVGRGGLEPPAPGLSDRSSAAELPPRAGWRAGLEPATSALATRRSTVRASATRESPAGVEPAWSGFAGRRLSSRPGRRVPSGPGRDRTSAARYVTPPLSR